MALLLFKHTYRRAGFEPAGPELPDYLPVLLEFAALAGDPGARLLDMHRAGLQLLRQGLHEQASPYAAVLDAVDATLPALSARQAADVRRLAADGPPAEDLGLDPVGTAPFAPPELLGNPGEHR
jgi:nitrate reductase molybdenum cofactor assembly chaperone NarJ/NarW